MGQVGAVIEDAVHGAGEVREEQQTFDCGLVDAGDVLDAARHGPVQIGDVSADVLRAAG